MPYFDNNWVCGPPTKTKPFTRIFDIRKFRTVSDEEEKYINHMLMSFNNGDSNISKLPKNIYDRNILDGMSGEKTRHFYNNISSLDECNYLEVGTWAGSTLCSHLYKNKINATAIDNFSWGGQQTKMTFFNNVNSVKNIQKQINFNDKYHEIDFVDENKHLQIFDSDSFSVNLNDLKFVYNVYLYDGDHSYDSHYNALTFFIEKMDNIFIFIVDDWNIPRVRDATYRSIKDLHLQILAECEVIYTDDDTHTTHNDGYAEKNYWNGLYSVVLNKK